MQLYIKRHPLYTKHESLQYVSRVTKKPRLSGVFLNRNTTKFSSVYRDANNRIVHVIVFITLAQLFLSSNIVETVLSNNVALCIHLRFYCSCFLPTCVSCSSFLGKIQNDSPNKNNGSMLLAVFYSS
jgi:hypothetical protein